MFVRYVTDEVEPPNRKVFETLAMAKADFARVQMRIWQGEYELGLLFHLPGISDVREAARIVDDKLAGGLVNTEVVLLEMEQSSNRRMSDLINTTFKDLDLSGLEELFAKKTEADRGA